jgi:hypothetical protein
MKTSRKNEALPEGFHAVKFMRQVRDQISKDIQDMPFEEILAYFKKRRESGIEKKS